VKQRRDELRTMAESRIAAIEAIAITQIELSCLEAQTQIATSGLTSKTAKQFIEGIPKIETLMPNLSFRAMAGEAEPPIAEQLVSSNALRQRRFRERQRALKDNAGNGPEALQPPLQRYVSDAEDDWSGEEAE
jgi:hypothetical protein